MRELGKGINPGVSETRIMWAIQNEWRASGTGERYLNRTVFFIMAWHRIVKCEPTLWLFG